MVNESFFASKDREPATIWPDEDEQVEIVAVEFVGQMPSREAAARRGAQLSYGFFTLKI